MPIYLIISIDFHSEITRVVGARKSRDSAFREASIFANENKHLIVSVQEINLNE